MYSKEMKPQSQRAVCTPTFTAGAHATAKTWGRPERPFITARADTESMRRVTQWNNVKPLKGNLAFCDNINQMVLC